MTLTEAQDTLRHYLICIDIVPDTESAREVAQHIAESVTAADAACTWRVCWKKRGGMAEDWKHELKPSLREARSRALDLRDRLCIAIVQTKHTDGTWIDA